MGERYTLAELAGYANVCVLEAGLSAGYLEAAIAVLEAAGRPLTSQEITEEALRRGLIQPTGKTPKATLTARHYVHVRDAAEPRVVRLAERGNARARRGSVRWTLPG